MSDMMSILQVSGSGMRAQSERVRVIAENMANADTAPTKPGEKPYTRKTITFENVLDRQIHEKLVKVKDIQDDTKSAYQKKYMPGHPGADADGYVTMPNVNSLIESMDMKEAGRSYEANLGMFSQTRDMINKTISLLE
ncbi:MAG: flagellar basal body rod protein FlgC [Alphaproteobacteria bacterium]|jgi:flagellar basal-body rod protein FlgC|nr:flagellar basal body rod protein FlgC [Alphaproteobacteria bacterium]MBP9867994.1 flagellar basal body rod protein FlgC [Alphaproteobacteria bacterium]